MTAPIITTATMGIFNMAKFAKLFEVEPDEQVLAILQTNDDDDLEVRFIFTHGELRLEVSVTSKNESELEKFFDEKVDFDKAKSVREHTIKQVFKQ